MLVLGAFFLVGVAAGFPMLTGPFPAPFSTVLALALPSVGGAAAAYVLALVVPGNINRVVHGILAFLIALAATIGVWLLIFLSGISVQAYLIHKRAAVTSRASLSR